MGTLSWIDMAVFFGSLLVVMILGLWAGRKEDTAEDYYLAGKTTRWWGVAGSIFGSNVSANHIVGMMGIGFTVGFAQSHFEITAILGLILLCYGFLPVYRRLNIYTLSEYLSRRYNEPSRIIYAVIMLVTIVAIQTVPAFYIGSRSLNILLLDNETVDAALEKDKVRAAANKDLPPEEVEQPKETSLQIKYNSYVIGILIMAVVTGTYTVIGGLKAVIVTDVLQSVMMLVAGVIVAYLTFAKIGGWTAMMALDNAAEGAAKMHLYLPSDHKDLPWTGVLTGLMILHLNYWGTNQFIVQRVLSARSDKDARIGVIVAGFFKLTIPFISIGTGVAAFYLFSRSHPGVPFDSDTTFPMLIRQVVSPVRAGLAGIVAAGLVGAILSSIDSMLNSAATIITFDFYQRLYRPKASQRELILVGRACIVVIVTTSALLAILIMDPNAKSHFFLNIAAHTSKLAAGVVVAFAMGMFWRRATPAGGLSAIVSGIVFSYGIQFLYDGYLVTKYPALVGVLGEQLNFCHTAIVAAFLAAVVHVVVSLRTSVDPEKSKLTWTQLGGHDPRRLRRAVVAIVVTILFYAALGAAVFYEVLTPLAAGAIAAACVIALFVTAAWGQVQRREADGTPSILALIREDRVWAGLLLGVAMFMLFYFY